MEEEWRAYSGDKRYFVSNAGRVRGIRVDLMRPYFRCGYPCVAIKRKTTSIHRMVAQEFLDNPENKPEVNHLDGVKTNNTYTNLEWATKLENVRHAFVSGLHSSKHGENNNLSKFTNAEAGAIRKELLLSGRSNSSVARQLGVSPATIWSIKNGVSYIK